MVRKICPTKIFGTTFSLDAGADINRATYDATFTALHHALAKGHMDVARLLVEKGADVNVLNEGGCYGSSLHYSVYKNDLEFTKYRTMIVRV